MTQTQTSYSTVCNDTNTTFYRLQWHKHRHHILPSAITQTQTLDQMWGVGWVLPCSQKITVAYVLILSLSRFRPSMNEFAVHAGKECGTMVVMTWSSLCWVTWQCSASETQLVESLLVHSWATWQQPMRHNLLNCCSIILSTVTQWCGLNAYGTWRMKYLCKILQRAQPLQ